MPRRNHQGGGDTTHGRPAWMEDRFLTRGRQPYTMGADGNTLTGGGRTNTWDSQNRLVQCVAGGSSTSKHKFVGSLGHTSEDETGLIYMRVRWMDPAVGRFISEDPARDGGNWFEYCRGNPVNGVDQDGRLYKDVLELFALFVGMGLAAKESPSFKKVFAAWFASMAWESIGFLAARAGAQDGHTMFFQALLGMAAGIVAGPLTSPRDKAGAFWGGYAAMLMATYVLLDIETQVSSGCSLEEVLRRS